MRNAVSRSMGLGAAIVACTMAVPAAAQSARDIIVQASFESRSKQSALQSIGTAQRAAAAVLARSPGDREALLMQATAGGYQARLTRNRSEALATRKLFEALVRRAPNDPEAQLGLGAWHVDAVAKLGPFVSRTMLGAQKGLGLAALDRAVALGGDRAAYAGFAALMRLQVDPADKRGRALAEQASRAEAPTAFDRAIRRAATAMVGSFKTGNAAATKALAARLLPFGYLKD
jgi:hypothetical protein